MTETEAAERAEAGEERSGAAREERKAQVIVIRPSRGWVSLGLKELWEYREIVFFLTWRDIKVRYKQTVLGMLWAILQPLVMMLVFAVIFGILLKQSIPGVPYALYAYSGLIIWTFFANGVTMSANSMVTEANTIKKIYFPRMAIPIASITAGLVDFVLAFVILVGMLVYYAKAPTWAMLMLPVFLLLAIVTTLGAGFWLSALNVLFRDVRHAIPFVVQALLFLSPVAYSSTILPKKGVWLVIYGLNPMAGVINGFRWTILGMPLEQPLIVLTSSAVALVLLVTGAYFFKRVERSFADVV